MEITNIKDLIKTVRKFAKSGVVYNVDIRKDEMKIKEKSMTKKLTLQDAMNAIATLTTTVTQGFADAKTDRQLIKADIVGIKKDIVDIKKDIVRLDQKFDDLYKNNPNLIQ